MREHCLRTRAHTVSIVAVGPDYVDLPLVAFFTEMGLPAADSDVDGHSAGALNRHVHQRQRIFSGVPECAVQ